MEAAVKKDQKDVAAFIGLGQVELMGGPRERKAGEERLERAVSFDPQNIKAENYLGLAGAGRGAQPEGGFRRRGGSFSKAW